MLFMLLKSLYKQASITLTQLITNGLGLEEEGGCYKLRKGVILCLK